MCGVEAKPVAHLMKFHLLQWEVVKVNFFMNSNVTLTVFNLHQKIDPKVQQDFKGQHHYKVKSRSHHDAVHPQPLTNVPTKQQLPTAYGCPDIAQTRFYRSRFTTARSKLKSRSDHDVPHLHPLTNVPTKYQLPTPLRFPRYSPDKIL